MHERTEVLQAVLAGTLSRDEAANRLAVSPERLEEWVALLEAGRELTRAEVRLAQHASARQVRRAVWSVGAAALAVATVWVAGAAWAGGTPICAQTLPAPLVTFCPNAPAVASEINGNFAQLVAWLEQKVGPVGQPLPSGVITNAQLDPVLACPNNSRADYGLCMFWVQGAGAYSLTYKQAGATCRTNHAHLCSRAEVGALQAAGAPDSCQYGWFADRTDETHAYAGYPMQSTSPGCGAPGINESLHLMTDLLGGYCCK